MTVSSKAMTVSGKAMTVSGKAMTVSYGPLFCRKIVQQNTALSDLWAAMAVSMGDPASTAVA